MRTILRRSENGSTVADVIRDLIVVIVGILAALWLESWWQDRQDRAEEVTILQGLRTEFVMNRAQLVDKMSAWNESVVATEHAHGLMGRPITEELTTEAREVFVIVDRMQFYDPTQGQLTSVMSSGKLGLVRNADLRARIADWPALVADLDIERSLAFYEMTEGLRSVLNRHTSTWADSQFEFRVEALLADREVDNHLGDWHQNLLRMTNEAELILVATDEIIELIDAELPHPVKE